MARLSGSLYLTRRSTRRSYYVWRFGSFTGPVDAKRHQLDQCELGALSIKALCRRAPLNVQNVDNDWMAPVVGTICTVRAGTDSGC